MARTVTEYVNALLYDARCFRCLPDRTQLEVQTYILASIAGLGVDPNQLANLSKCIACFQRRTLLELQASLLVYINGTYWWPGGMILNARCYDCIPWGMMRDVQTYLLTNDPSWTGGSDINQIAQTAKAFHALDIETLLQIQVYALAILAGAPTDPDGLWPYAWCMSCVPDPLLTAIATQALDYLEPIPETSIREEVDRPTVDPPDPPPPPPPPDPPPGRPPPPPRGPPGRGFPGRGGPVCQDDPTGDNIPIIQNVTYVATIIATVDILVPKCCCSGGWVFIYGSALPDMSGAVFCAQIAVPPRVANYLLAGVNLSGYGFAYYATRQVCTGGLPVSDLSNIVQGVQDPEDSLQVDLVSYWPIVEASGTTRMDIISTNHLTDEASNVNQVAGIISFAAQCGTGSVTRKLITAAVAPQLYGSGGKSFTIQLWMYMASWGSSACCLAQWGPGGAADAYLLWNTTTSGQVAWAVKDAGGTLRSCVKAAFPLSAWKHCIFGYDHANSRIFFIIDDGVPIYAACVGVWVTSGIKFSVGNYTVTGVGAAANIRADEVGYWDKVLTPTEITWLYNAGAGRTYPFAP